MKKVLYFFLKKNVNIAHTPLSLSAQKNIHRQTVRSKKATTLKKNHQIKQKKKSRQKSGVYVKKKTVVRREQQKKRLKDSQERKNRSRNLTV